MPASTEGDEPRTAEDEPRSLAPGSPARTVLDFLVEHPEDSFAPDELSDRTGVDGDRIEPVLEWLAGMDVAERGGRRWSVGPDDRRGSLTAMMHGLATVEERYPAPDWEEWKEYAEEQHPPPTEDERGEHSAERYPAPDKEKWDEYAVEKPR